MRVVTIGALGMILAVAAECGGAVQPEAVTTGALDASRDAVSEAVLVDNDRPAFEVDSSSDGSTSAVVESPDARSSESGSSSSGSLEGGSPEAGSREASAVCVCALRGDHCGFSCTCCAGYGLACTGNGLCDIVGPN